MARPDAQFRWKSGKEPFRAGDVDGGVAKLALRGGADGAAEHVRHELHAVADAKHRATCVEHGCVAARRSLGGDALRASGQDDPDGMFGPNPIRRGVGRQDLGVDRQLAEPPRDELRGTATEIEHDDGLMAHGDCSIEGTSSGWR